MSIVTGRRLNKFYKKLSKSFENIEKKLENVLYSTETDKHIFSDSKSGFVPKTRRKYDEEFRYLRADGKWYSPIADDKLLVKKSSVSIDARDAAVKEVIIPDSRLRLEGEGILLINAYKISIVGSNTSNRELLASYAYSIAVGTSTDPAHDYEDKEIVKIEALSNGLSSTYGTISAVNQFDGDDNYGTLNVKVNKGYTISIKMIF